MHEKGDEKTQL